MLTIRKASNVYRADLLIDGTRTRLSLGTRNHDAAYRLGSRIEKAMAEGPLSAIWQELKAVLPEFTFQRIADCVGYVPPIVGPEKPKPTWLDLRTAFEEFMTRRITLQKMSENTRDRYLQTLKEFEVFLEERKVTLLEQMNRALLEKYKVWRIARIKEKKFSRGGTGLVLDVAILHKAFAVAVEAELITSNPVKFEGRPGDSPTRGAQPFDSNELVAMQNYALQDLLAFLLLRWTGLRGSDAVTLKFSEMHFHRQEVERIPRKNKKKVIIPIHPDLLAALTMERERRKAGPDDLVLVQSNGMPLTRKRLYYRTVALGRRAGVPNAHPHRFRDTFAVDMLARGASPYDVAKLLGDTIQTVEKHYAAFVRELRERVRRMMVNHAGLAAFAEPHGEVLAKEMTKEV